MMSCGGEIMTGGFDEWKAFGYSGVDEVVLL